jgi:RecA-family ATPase
VLTSLNRDIANLSKKIEERGDVSLVIIDPITNYLEGLSMNKEQEMRGVLVPLANMAQRLNVCVLTVGHLNRRGKDAATLFDQVMGAAAFVSVARQTLFFTPDPDDENEFAHIMGLGRKTTTPAVKYRTKCTPVTWDGKTSDVISVEWTGKSDADMESAAQPAKKAEKSVTSRAVLFVTGLLRTGAKRKAEIDQALKENGFKIDALDFTTIKKRCKAESRPLPGKAAGYEWYLASE